MARRLPALVLIVCVATGLARGQECATPRPEWVFCEDFEGSQFLSQWQEVSHGSRKQRETDPAHVYRGGSSLKLVFPPGDTTGAGWMHHWWDPDQAQDEMYLRWYVRYSAGFDYGGWDVKLAGLEGHRPGVRYRPGAGVTPDGTWFQSRGISLGVFDSRGPEDPKEPFFYYYHMDQGGPWGSFGYQNRLPRVALQDERWYCIEIRVKLNTVQDTGGTYQVLADGEQTMWIDGVEQAHYSAIRWRAYPDVRINDLFQSAWIGQPTATTEQYRWEDNYVVSPERIGCPGTGAAPPPAPQNLRIVP